jgi:hypothetical protein
MLSQVQSAAEEALAALEERIDAGAQEELLCAAASVSDSLRAMATFRHAKQHGQKLWERQAHQLRDMVARLEQRAAQRCGAAVSERPATRGASLAGRGAGAAALVGRSKKRPALHWAGFLVLGARTRLAASPTAGVPFAGSPGIPEGQPAGTGAQSWGRTGAADSASATSPCADDDTGRAVREILADLGYPGEVVARFIGPLAGAEALAAMGSGGLAALGVSAPRHQAVLLAWAREESARASAAAVAAAAETGGAAQGRWGAAALVAGVLIAAWIGSRRRR